MRNNSDAHHRSILKALSWRFCATITTMVIVFSITGKYEVALAAGGLDVVAKLILYYLHERAWGRVGLGKNEHPLSSLDVREPLKEEDMEIVKKKLVELGYISEE